MTRLFVDRLTLIDFSYLHPERGMLGETWLLDIELEGTLDAQGMVLDFATIKQQVKDTVDLGFDHKLLVPTRYAGTQVEQRDGRCSLVFRLTSGEQIRHTAPSDATCLLDAEAVTPETLSTAIIARLRPALPDNIDRIRITLHPERRPGACYQVSHGLRQHAGNCQRIAHGHRSYIEILRDGKRTPELEQAWAQRWCDIYIGTRANLQQELEREGTSYYCFGYNALQGRFELELPSRCCYLIETESTVENLAQHIAGCLKQAHPQSRFQVRAFEGVDKGAICET